MNNNRRKALAQILDELTTLNERLEAVLDEEQEAYDNMPEGIQCSERGELMEENIGNLEDAKDSIDCAIDSINNILEL